MSIRSDLGRRRDPRTGRFVSRDPTRAGALKRMRLNMGYSRGSILDREFAKQYDKEVAALVLLKLRAQRAPRGSVRRARLVRQYNDRVHRQRKLQGISSREQPDYFEGES